MVTLWDKIKLWTKITIFSAATIYLLLLILNNKDQTATIWIWFGNAPTVSLLKLIPSLLLAGVIGTLLVRMAYGTIRQLRQYQKHANDVQMRKDLEDLKAKAGMLQTKPTATATTTTATEQHEEHEHPPTASS
jgi:uncharacterized membrane protein YraQ (UPF0718 family)